MVVCFIHSVLIWNANNSEKQQMPLNLPFADFLISFYSHFVLFTLRKFHFSWFEYFFLLSTTIYNIFKHFCHTLEKTWVDDITFATERFRVVWFGCVVYLKMKTVEAHSIIEGFSKFIMSLKYFMLNYEWPFVKYIHRYVICANKLTIIIEVI